MLNLLFDVDDTLYDRFSPFEAAYRELFGRRFPLELRPLFGRFLLRGNELLDDAMSGRMAMERMYILRFSLAMADLGAAVTDQEALEFQDRYAYWQKHISANELLKETLAFCSRPSIFLGIITNGPSEHQRNKYRTLGISRWIPEEHVIASGDVGAQKPRPEVFQAAIRQWNLAPEATWYVGDSYDHDILGAKPMGWHTIWLDRNHRCEKIEPSAADVIVHTEAKLCAELRRLAEREPLC